MSSFGVLVACGVKSEARAAHQGGSIIPVFGGGRPDVLEKAFGAALALMDFVYDEVPGPASIGGIASFGLCGALDPTLASGTVILGESSDPVWSALVQARLESPPVIGDIFSDGSLVSTAEQKAALRARTGAIAVDMESHVAGRIAAERKLPFLVLRVVSDCAGEGLPPAFTVAIGPEGTTNLGAIALSLVRHPFQIPRFIASAQSATRALAVLRRVGRLLGPRLGLPDLG